MIIINQILKMITKLGLLGEKPGGLEVETEKVQVGAHQTNLSTSQAMVNLKLVLMLKSTNEDKFMIKTSKEWLDDLRNTANIVISDPDGWNRKNFDFSFNHEEITKKHFILRLRYSTVLSLDKLANITYEQWCEDI